MRVRSVRSEAARSWNFKRPANIVLSLEAARTHKHRFPDHKLRYACDGVVGTCFFRSFSGHRPKCFWNDQKSYVISIRMSENIA